MAFAFDEEMKKVFYAGVGAMALTGEKAKALVDILVEKGQITVEQGKVMNEELKHKIKDKVKENVTVVEKASTSDFIENLENLTPDELALLKEKLSHIENNESEK